MTKNYKHIILMLWFSLLWASPTMASFEDKESLNLELFSISKDTLNPKEKDSTKTKKPDPAYLSQLQQMAAVRNGSGFHSAITAVPIKPIKR